MEDGSATPAPAARQLYCPVGGLRHARCRGGGTTGSLSFLSSAFPPFLAHSTGQTGCAQGSDLV